MYNMIVKYIFQNLYRFALIRNEIGEKPDWNHMGAFLTISFQNI